MHADIDIDNLYTKTWKIGSMIHTMTHMELRQLWAYFEVTYFNHSGVASERMSL